MEFQIGNITIPNNICLAPMAGATTVAMRGICHEFGAGFQPTELVSARSILYNGVDYSFKYLVIDPKSEGVCVIQLFGGEEEDFDFAIKAICEDPRLCMVDIIDINMGCPVPKVIKTGSGSALMQNPQKAASIVRTAVKAASSYDKPVTVKTRIGFDENSLNGPEFVKYLADSGAASIAVHGRTARQMYHGDVNIELIAEMREAVREYKIPFLANGDISSREACRHMLAVTEATGVMIGRAAVGNPWIFRQLSLDEKEYASRAANGVDSEETDIMKVVFPSVLHRKKMLLHELELTAQYKPEEFAVCEMRSSMVQYVKGIPGGARLKVDLCRQTTIDGIRNALGV